MLSEKVNNYEVYFLAKELLASIREINRRIDEIKIILKNPECSSVFAKNLRERICRLQDSKFCLIYSIYDLRNDIIKLNDDRDRKRLEEMFNITNLYRELKNL